MHNPLAINNIQRYLIKTYFDNDIFDNIAEPNRNPKLIIRALNAIIFEGKLGKNKIRSLKKAGVWEPVLEARRIIAHHCPQNRTLSSVVVQNPRKNFVYYQDQYGEIAEEQRGFFNLSIRNDNTADPINRDSIVSFIRYLVEKEIQKHETPKAGEACQEEIEIKGEIELCAQGPELRFSSPHRSGSPDSNSSSEVVSDISVNDDVDFALQERAEESCMRRAYNRVSACTML